MKYIPIACCLFALFFICDACQSKKKYQTWEQYKGSNENIHYSSLDQVDTSNVKDLQVAWEYHTGDADTAHHSQIQCNPIIIDGILYGVSPQLKLFAIEAGTGKPRWVFNPVDSVAGDNKSLFFILNNSRGVTYWSDGEKDKRIYYTAGSELLAIDAVTGTRVPTFGKNGALDLHEGLDREVADLFVTATSPPVIYKDLLITGSRVDEGPHAAPGHLRAFDVRTGKLKWIFHTIPHPGEDGYESWDDPEAYRFIGGANAWSGLSLDQERGIVYAATGSASYDFYGGRRTGNNLFANSLLAIDATTGKRIWHFQYIHHDVWDRDLSSPPALVTVTKAGKQVPAVAITTKTGFVFVFNRITGESLFPIEERPVPQVSELTGEKLSPTQPFPLAPAPFMRQLFTEKDINPYLPDSSIEDIRRRWASYKHDHMYDPLSFQGTIVFPGLDGGAEWGGPSYDPATGILYVNANEMPWALTAVDISAKQAIKENNGVAGRRLYEATCMSCHGPERKGSGNFPSLVNIQSKYTAASLDTLIQTGRRMMPAFKQLNPAERNAIASYVLENKKTQAMPFTDTMHTRNDPFRLPYSVTGYNKFLSKEGYPAIAPPWGTLNALDLNTGQYIWRKPLGNDTSVKGLKEPTGVENYGASVITAGGLLFIAATKDGKFRAFNKRNGELLWETSLPAPGFATPSIYEVNGRQFIVIACGGGKMGLRSGDSYIAFSLPASK